MSKIEFKNLKKQYDNAPNPTIENLNLTINDGEFVAFVGPSGCGKSTTLRMLAGLEDVTDGEIIIGDKVVNNVLPRERDIAMVFQNYALYPHKTVYKNISFGLKMNKVPKDEIDKKVSWAADILGITDQLEKKPKDLSGGQRQRVALARAIVKNSSVFLMDEPLSNLDAKLRVSTRNEISALHKQLKSTFVYVTHDQVEAMTMATKIVVMNKGNIMQVGTPKELYQRPNNLFVATFIGTPQMNMFDAKVKLDKLEIGNLKLPIPNMYIEKLKNYNGKEIKLGIRPEDIATSALELETYKDDKISLKVKNIELIGKNYFVYSSLANTNVTIDTVNEYAINEEIDIVFKPHKLHLFDIKTGERI